MKNAKKTKMINSRGPAVEKHWFRRQRNLY